MRTPSRSIRLASAAAALALPALVPATAGATWRGAVGHVAYDTFDAHNDFSAFRIRPDGTHNKEVVRNASDPAWSANGRHIVFHRDDTIYIARADGKHVHKVVKAPSSSAGLTDPSWSSDGRHIVFTVLFEREFGDEQVKTSEFIYRVRTGGGHLRRLHRGTFGVWSPRAKRIAFAQGSRIKSMRTDGKKVKTLVKGHGYLSSLDYSPDGRKLVYMQGISPSRIHVLNVISGHQHGLSGKRTGPVDEAQWKPGGKRIAYLFSPFQKPGTVAPPTIMRSVRPNGTGRHKEFTFVAQRWPFSFSWQALP